VNTPKRLAPAPGRQAGDQADGLRRLFDGRRAQVVPVVANAHVGDSAIVLERLSIALAELGAHTLVVDASDTSPAPQELIDIDLPSCIERLGPKLSYLAARGVPRHHVNARGSSAAWLGAVEQAAPFADVLLVNAEARDLCRLLGSREVCPIVISGLESISITEAYASMKLLSQRQGLKVFDLLVAMASRPRRAEKVAERLGSCADLFLSAVLRGWAAVDCAEPLPSGARAPHQLLTPSALRHLAADQLGPVGGEPSHFAPPAAMRPTFDDSPTWRGVPGLN
jgi:flagellar biosynthesis protein FlhG